MDGLTALCPRCRKLEARIAALEKRVTELTAALEAAQRAGKRQAAPFRKTDGPAAEPKKPGRKQGRRHGLHAHRAVPASHEIDETYEAPLPDRCPSCGGRQIEETHTAKQHQTEIPRQPISRSTVSSTSTSASATTAASGFRAVIRCKRPTRWERRAVSSARTPTRPS